jgi:hypothetical protein
MPSTTATSRYLGAFPVRDLVHMSVCHHPKGSKISNEQEFVSMFTTVLFNLACLIIPNLPVWRVLYVLLSPKCLQRQTCKKPGGSNLRYVR